MSVNIWKNKEGQWEVSGQRLGEVEMESSQMCHSWWETELQEGSLDSTDMNSFLTNGTQWHAQHLLLRAMTGDALQLLGPYYIQPA